MFLEAKQALSNAAQHNPKWQVVGCPDCAEDVIGDEVLKLLKTTCLHFAFNLILIADYNTCLPHQPGRLVGLDTFCDKFSKLHWKYTVP